MIAAAILCGMLAGTPEQTPVSGDCSEDAATLVEEAEALVAISGPAPPPETLARARGLLRKARRIAPSPAVALRAADLAFQDGDAEEGGDLLAEAAESGPDLLSPCELLILARRAEQRRQWREAIGRYEAMSRLLASRGEASDWIERRRQELELEAQAEAIAPPSTGPSAEARLALADGKQALAAGRLREARERLRVALGLSPAYVEALLALAAVETRAGRPAAAIRACRSALAAEPDRFETLAALANLLWKEPDRRAKEESLDLLDRAARERPEVRSLIRLSATRWAELGDAPRALERLDRYLERASAAERADLESLREALSRRVRGVPEERPEPEASSEEPSSGAIDRWRKAEVYAARGDADSLASALTLLSEAERLDPSFARAAELEAAIHEKRSEWPEAEAALRRALTLDPSRASSFESLARLLARDPHRAAESEKVWHSAADAGSTEALLHLAQSAEAAGRRAEALSLYTRYRAEAPAGVGAADAARAIERLESRRERLAGAAAGGVIALLAAAGAVIYRRRSGLTFSEWLAHNPGSAVKVRPVVGRLRHEALKHGGMLLRDGAKRLVEEDDDARRSAAALLFERLAGAGGSRGLIEEAENAVSALQSMAREDGVRLNLAHRDPVFSWILRGLSVLRRARRGLRRIARSGSGSAPKRIVSSTARLLHRAAHLFAYATGAEIERALDHAAALPVRLDALGALLSRVAAEERASLPTLEALDAPELEEGLPNVRMAPQDWETLWRNLFGNAVGAARQMGWAPLRLGLSAQRRRDPVTGAAGLRIVLADNLPGRLTAEDIRERSPDRGWGVVTELLRRNDGSIDMVLRPAVGFTKGIVVDLPVAEEPA